MDKNRHLDKRAARFLGAYFHAIHQFGLCCILNSARLAHLLQITSKQLNHLATDTNKHYTEFNIPKNNGQLRKIDAPKPELAIKQFSY